MENMTLSEEPITKGQIGKIGELLDAGLRKSNLKSVPVQMVLENQGPELIKRMLAVIYSMAHAESELIRRNVKVDRNQSPKEMLEATGRQIYSDDKLVKAMPRGDGGEVEVLFFKLGRFVSDDDLDKEYELRGLTPCDPYSLGKVNQDDPIFADTHPNATHWKGKNGMWCFCAFVLWDDKRGVSVDHDGYAWRAGRWWFSGIRK